MKSVDSLTRQIKVWQHKYQNFGRFLFQPRAKNKARYLAEQSDCKTYYRAKPNRLHRGPNSLLMLAVMVVMLTSAVGYRFYNQPQLAVGTVSPVKIEAPRDGQFEDTKTTDQKRKKVRTGIVPILKHNREATTEIKLQLAKHLSQIEQLRRLAEPFPFVDTQILALESQQYLRSCRELELKQIFELVSQPQSDKLMPKELVTADSGNVNLRLQQTVADLRNYRQQASTQAFESLLAKITLTRYRYSLAWKKLQQKPVVRLNQAEIRTILDLSDRTWETTQKAIFQAAERILTQGIAPGMPSNLLEEAVTIQLSSHVPPQTAHLADNLLLEVLQPNLEEDKEATLNIAAKAASAIEPVIVEIQQGEVIVDKGEVITQADFVLLDGFGLSQRSINWRGLLLSGTIVAAAFGLFLWLQQRIRASLRHRDYLLLCLLSISTLTLVIFPLPYNNLPAVGLLVSSFYGSELAFGQIILLAGLVTFATTGFGWEFLLAGLAGGLLAAAVAGRLRSREGMARLGIIIGLTQGGVYLVTKLILSASATTIWSAVLPGAILNGLSGLAWSIVALGISPYLERLFDLVTPIRLAELSNPNLPLLKKLATETPGTFQHTMFVASLAEAAARELNCNVELVRAGTLYHDIGKMHDPLGFIENQMGNPNKHDEIDDPWQSAEIIKKHVTEGLVMARKYGLPKAIRDFIPEHQGTLLISYFYHQAQQKAQQIEGIQVHEADFRYDGPIPQSREAGIMMLADGSEAALRSLKDATPEQALSIVRKIFKARWRDGQLQESGLRYEELPLIANIFVKVWQQFNHKRIPYPKAILDNQSGQR